MHEEVYGPLTKAMIAVPAVIGFLLLQGIEQISDAPPWALQLGIVGVGLFFGGLFAWTQYWPWIKQCKITDDKCRDDERAYDRQVQQRQWDALERMSTTHAESLKALSAALGNINNGGKSQ